MPKYVFTDEQVTEMVHLYYTERWTLAMIAQKFNTVHGVIHHRIKKVTSLAMRKRGRPRSVLTLITRIPAEEHAVIERMYLEGMCSLPFIAKRYETYPTVIRHLLLGRNVTMRKAHLTEARHEPEAIRMVNEAVKRGLLLRGPCEVCGLSPYDPRSRKRKLRSRVIGHHDNYNNPLTVRWLCYKHHREWHMFNESVPKDAGTHYTPLETAMEQLAAYLLLQEQSAAAAASAPDSPPQPQEAVSHASAEVAGHTSERNQA